MLKEAFYRLERCRFFMRKASLPIVKRTGISAGIEERKLHLISSNLHGLREIETWTDRISRNRCAALTKADFLVGEAASFRAENESNAAFERRETRSRFGRRLTHRCERRTEFTVVARHRPSIRNAFEGLS